MVEMATMTLAERLISFNVDLEAHFRSVSEVGRLHSCNRSAGRILVGPIGLRTDDSQPRLERTSNIDLSSLDSLAEIPETHPLFHVRNGVWSALVSGLVIASGGDEEALNKISGCSRVDMYCATSPNFENVGLISKFMQNSCLFIFQNATMPVVNTVGVSALPAKTLATAVFEFYE